MSTGPYHSRQPTAETRQQESKQRKARRLDCGLDVHKEENDPNNRNEQASKEPPEAALVSDGQKHGIPDNPHNDSDSQQYVSCSNHWTTSANAKLTNDEERAKDIPIGIRG
jgi:hypothetical protein